MAGIRGKAVTRSSGADAEPGWHVVRASGTDRRAGDGKGSSAMSSREVDQALRAFKEAGNTAGCISVPRGLEDHGVVANVRQYTTVISTMSRRGDWRGALDMLREMERKGVEANTYTYNSLISARREGNGRGRWSWRGRWSAREL